MNLEILTLVLSLFTALLVIILLFRRQPDPLHSTRTALEEWGNRLFGLFSPEFKANREEMARQSKDHFEHLTTQLIRAQEEQGKRLEAMTREMQATKEQTNLRLEQFQDRTSLLLSELRKEVFTRLEAIRTDNNQQLEKVRQTVDEKLQKTLEERLGHSFRLVQESLNQVQQGLGEMQSLAHGVGDLKRVLTNVKTRGVMGELQLGNILEQLLNRDQYAVNVATIPDSSNFVEFAIKFPGTSDDLPQVWLPIDSKFPLDKYYVLVDAYVEGDGETIQRAQKELWRTVRSMAKDIHDKYIAPPYTTDFGVLFVPIEGLYAEIVRQPELAEELQRQYRILIAGPTNLAAFLNALQMGFRTLAIEKRSSEVWSLLAQVKTEFGKFGATLEKVNTKLKQASDSMDKVSVRSRAIEKKLRDVGELPAGEEPAQLDFKSILDPDELFEKEEDQGSAQ